MRRSRSLLALLVAVVAAVVAAGCGAGAGSAGSPSASPSPSGGAASAPWMRLITTQAIAPLNAFVVGPVAVITADGRYVIEGPVPAIFPGPLLPNLVQRSISDAGRARIIDEAQRLGLLAGKTDFGGGAMPGAVTGRIELTVDGSAVVLTGDPNAQIVCITTPCDPAAGSPEAFGDLWRKLASPGDWLAADLGPESTFTPAAYAILVGPAPRPDPAIGAQVADWPLDVPVGTFGGPVANGTARCGLVDGERAQVLGPALAKANALTQWTQGPATSATFGLTPRPIIANEDPCAETFGSR